MIYISFDIGVKNLAVCILDHTDDNLSIIDWNVICLADSKKQLKGANAVAEVLFHELDNLIGKLQEIGIHYYDKVFIENQPSNLNGIMKTIQYLIFSYFDLLRHWDKTVGEVILINPSLKLQNHPYVPERQNDQKLSRREKYKYNKMHSIEICKQYVKDCDILCKYFSSHKKKDDLADSCLQAVSYIRKSGVDANVLTLNAKNFIIQ